MLFNLKANQFAKLASHHAIEKFSNKEIQNLSLKAILLLTSR